MSYLGPLIAIVFIVIVARLLLKKFYPHAVLLIAGLLMLAVSFWLPGHEPAVEVTGGPFVFDLFRYINSSFAETNAGVGLMIMAIGGFVAYIDDIGASEALVYLALKPLRLFSRQPYLLAVLVIPIGQLLFVCIPSAAGLGLLLMASVFPILINLGVSRLSAVSVITSCTAMGMGPASAITASATSIIEKDTVFYFLKDQIPLAVPLSITMMVAYYFVNRYYDKKMKREEIPVPKIEKSRLKAPLYYAIIPILPLILLILFSQLFDFFAVPIELNTTTVMFICLFVALTFELVRKRKPREVLKSMSVFWNGMGNIFKSVVTLIIAADIFSKGLISLGFIDGLVGTSQNLGLGGAGIGIVMTVMIFLASVLMGSGNASFFAFGPLVPDIAAQLGMKSSAMILPMQFSASMGRTVSPVAGVLIATAEVAEVSPFDIVKRNVIPLGAALIVMILYLFI
ncbi:C4-dicarboxylate transporter DcuC [Sinomicrobium oceani]|uniref:C4-dicarboxylate transporter DcuC n=1 Tax=Sinomicrobium oceani TaxID=1150368 RepID=UPI00227A70A8|nr:C4-dicarboxylate transporter DcuC [Sinomicrobium oceani]